MINLKVVIAFLQSTVLKSNGDARLFGTASSVSSCADHSLAREFTFVAGQVMFLLSRFRRLRTNRLCLLLSGKKNFLSPSWQRCASFIENLALVERRKISYISFSTLWVCQQRHLEKVVQTPVVLVLTRNVTETLLFSEILPEKVWQCFHWHQRRFRWLGQGFHGTPANNSPKQRVSASSRRNRKPPSRLWSTSGQ